MAAWGDTGFPRALAMEPTDSFGTSRAAGASIQQSQTGAGDRILRTLQAECCLSSHCRWCIDEEDCLGRSKTSLGSSSSWPQTGTDGADGGVAGMFSPDASVNPHFWNWTKVFVGYCDGASCEFLRPPGRMRRCSAESKVEKCLWGTAMVQVVSFCGRPAGCGDAALSQKLKN